MLELFAKLLAFAAEFADALALALTSAKYVAAVLALLELLLAKVDELEVLLEFLQEGEGSEEEIDKIYQETLALIEDTEFRTALNEPEDELDCVVEINSGAGGTESCDWVMMLSRMYEMWVSKSWLKLNFLHIQPYDVAGYRNVSFEVKGEFPYGFLKGESGVHRLVRISPFNAQGKRQTTFASVFVYPMVDDSIEIDINPSDITMETFRASGAGGQHVNKTDSAVRLRHAPSGIAVECQEERSQHLNREKAMKMLRSRLYQIELEKRNSERAKIEAGKQSVEWGSQIRNYVLHPYKMVKDVRTGYETSQAQAVLDGDLEGFLKAYLLHGKA